MLSSFDFFICHIKRFDFKSHENVNILKKINHLLNDLISCSSDLNLFIGKRDYTAFFNVNVYW
jgi:hypothetical protein